MRREDAHHTGRFRHGEVEVRAGDRVGRAEYGGHLVGPSRVPDPPVDRTVHKGLCTLGLHTLGGGDLGDELLPTALQQLGHPVQHLAAVVRGRTGPAGKSLACRGNRVPDVLAGRERGVGQEPAARVVDRVAPAGLGPRESPTDVELVGLRHSDPLSHCLPSSQGDHPGVP